MTKRIGLLGGTFNPIHNGHLQLAGFVRQQLQLDEMQLLPNHLPPHKEQPLVTSAHRLAMAQAAINDEPQLQINPIELNRDEPSYSVETLRRLRQQHPQDAIFFTMGMDSFINLSSWYQWQQLLNLCHLVVCQRPGDQMPEQGPEAQLWQQFGIANNQLQQLPLVGHIICLHNPLWPVSSTEIRQQLQCGEHANQWLPPAVAQYIADHQLYRQ
ncbi:nicotinate-nucleotide adenylyltransferase [Neiella sp. HB171785]|uniref:Probable nicotinate-nucleotide adenylyltransferase n=1 Tax=Neiella litorisoli TaxID=2771431 RepID=A0A8J6UPY4_9GAMM|nr:nicotinate-nucleotide adenylyltransferase [Neiella litorisoli]MBD1389762.1 nicotinate-nucleotide adenylyltransferase [Neiella litorisoli]